MVDARTHSAPTVIFVDDWGWTSFDQVAAGLRHRRWRTIRLTSKRPGTGDLPDLRIADRLFYDDCWSLDAPANQGRVFKLLASGRVVDVIAAEQALDDLGLETPIGRALTNHSLGFAGTPPEQALDKFWVNEVLASGGIDTPRQAWAAELSPEEAARRFGLPLVIKKPIGAAGYQVRIATTVAEIATQLGALGGAQAPLFYQEHIHGRELLYCAVAGPRGPLVQHAFVVARRVFDRGPTALAALYDRPTVLAAGARATEVLAPQGFLQLCFIEAPDGRVFHIDANLRPWGMLAATLQLGIDFIDAYVRLIGGAEEPSEVQARAAASGRSADKQELRVQPNELFSAARSVALGKSLDSAALVLRTYARPLGLTYCGYLIGRAAVLMGRGVQRKLAARANGAIRMLAGATATRGRRPGGAVARPFEGDREPPPGGPAAVAEPKS